jgi:hypothetical protein
LIGVNIYVFPESTEAKTIVYGLTRLQNGSKLRRYKTQSLLFSPSLLVCIGVGELGRVMHGSHGFAHDSISSFTISLEDQMMAASLRAAIDAVSENCCADGQEQRTNPSFSRLFLMTSP